MKFSKTVTGAWPVALALLTVLSFTGLPVPVAAAQDAEPTAAQPSLRKEKLTIVGQDGARHDFSVEVAVAPRQQEVGLMFRTAIAPDGGMLFPWPQLQPSQMWMKNCPVPEDMVFIKADGTIGHIAEMTVPYSLANIDSHGPVEATLELQGGITAKLGIRVGDKVLSSSLVTPKS